MNVSSITADETMWIPAGYTYWKTGEFGMNPTHPPLTALIETAPLLFLNPTLPTEEESFKKLNIEHFGIDFLYRYNNNLDQIVFFSRIPVLILSLILGYFVYSWARKLYGINAGLFALFLYSFNPTVISQSGIAITDLGVSFFVFISAYFFWNFLSKRDLSSLVKTGILTGCAMISKVSGIFLIPIYLIYYLTINRSRKFLYSILGITGIAFLTMNAGYWFQFQPLSEVILNPVRYQGLLNLLPDNEIRNFAAFVIDRVPLPLTNYLKGIFIQTGPDALRGDYAYLLGEHRNFGGFRHYYIVGFLLKEPVSLILFLIISLIYFKKISSNKTNEVILLVPILVWFIFFSFNHLNAGMRHVLPAYPFIFVFLSKIVNLKGERIMSILIILGIIYSGSSLAITPNHHMYFNELAGGPNNGYKYFYGFEDIGQNMKGLKKYIDENEIQEIKLAKAGYWIPFEAQYRGIEYQKLQCEPSTGIIAIGVDKLIYAKGDPPGCYEWIKEHEPIEKIGYSIFIYNITKAG
jgi:hypothetical protein|tara:strand:- start:1779 stop:3341 length:1563 start_codon:yes stop_codon:yes gene_type:complete